MIEFLFMNSFARNQKCFSIVCTLVGVFLASLATMVLEIALTRLFSVLLLYHFVFMVVALAMAGLGLGGGLAARVPFSRVFKGGVEHQLAALSWLYSFCLIFCITLITRAASLNSLWIYILLSLLPFTLAGVILALAFGHYAEHSGRLYWADLSGAATGCLLVLPFLSLLGGINTILLASVIVAIAAMVFGIQTRRYTTSGWWAKESFFFLLIAGFFVQNLLLGRIEIDIRKIKADKGLSNLLATSGINVEVTYTRWDAFSRTDVVESESLPREKLIFIDGGAGSSMPKFDGDLENIAYLKQDVGFYPFLLKKYERVLIIGPGGGIDVLLALLGGSENITAVEINAASVAAVRHFADYNGHIYDDPRVNIVVDEGRSYLRRSNETFHLIYLSKVNTGVAEMAGYALAENYVYTLEAFGDYLNHLSEDGIIAIKLHEERDLLRAFITAVAALTKKGVSVSEAMRHFVILHESEHSHTDEPIELPLLLIKKSPFTREETQAAFLAASMHGFAVLYIPYATTGIPLGLELASGRVSLDKLISQERVLDLRPPTDDRPFFYEFYRELPKQLQHLLLLLAILVLIGALYLWLHRDKYGPQSHRFGLYFAGLGAGFMLIEVSMIQRLTLFLGHPTLAFTVLVFSLLMSSGVASLVTGRTRHERLGKVAGIAAAGVGVLGLFYIRILPLVVSKVLVQEAFIRSLIAGVLLAPLGFAMGIPFPLGLRLTKLKCNSETVSLMWGINGLMSVVGSVGAMALAIQWGYTWSIAMGIFMYFLSALLALGFLMDEKQKVFKK